MKRIVLVGGARPNFMKLAPVARALQALRDRVRFSIVHTSQHYDDDMSDVFFRQLEIPAPEVYLEVGSATHGVQTGRILACFEEYLLKMSAPQPAGVVVVGDVNSTMACALAAVKLGISTAHVEAGLRSFDRSMPEEINRVVTDAVCDLLFVSEPSGEENLRKEGISPEKIKYVGNVMIDTLIRELPAARELQMPARHRVQGRQYAYITLHRPSNVDDPEKLRNILRFLDRVSHKMPVLFPVHPRTKERLERFGLFPEIPPNLRLLEPQNYRESIGLMSEACVVLTDSGGIQEETSYLGIPCLTLRPNTERPATVSIGTNTVVGEDYERAHGLIEEIRRGDYRRGGKIPGWDGRAAERVAQALEEAWL